MKAKYRGYAMPIVSQIRKVTELWRAIRRPLKRRLKLLVS